LVTRELLSKVTDASAIDLGRFVSTDMSVCLMDWSFRLIDGKKPARASFRVRFMPNL
jgi:hypothetical protein